MTNNLSSPGRDRCRLIDELAAFRLAVAIVQRAHNDLKATVSPVDEQSARDLISYLQGEQEQE